MTLSPASAVDKWCALAAEDAEDEVEEEGGGGGGGGAPPRRRANTLRSADSGALRSIVAGERGGGAMGRWGKERGDAEKESKFG